MYIYDILNVVVVVKKYMYFGNIANFALTEKLRRGKKFPSRRTEGPL